MKNKFLKAVVIGSSLVMGFAAFAHGDMSADKAGHEHAKMTLGVGDLQEADAHALMLLHHINHVEIKGGQLAKSTSQNDKVKDYGDMLAKDHQDLDTKVTDLAGKHNVMFPAEMMHSGTGGAGEMGENNKMDEQKSDEMNRQDMQGDQAAKDDLKASDQAAEGTGGAGQAGTANTTDQQSPKDQTANAQMNDQTATGNQGMASTTGKTTTPGKTMTLSQKDMNLFKHTHEEGMQLQKLTGAQFDKTFVGDQVKDHQMAIQELKGAEASLKNDDVKDLVKTALDKMQNHLDEGKKLQASLRSAQARTPPAK